MGYQRPDYARVLVGQCDTCLRRAQALLLVHDPDAPLVGFVLRSIDDRPRSMNQ
jgi:hypothetical protein